MVCNTCNLEMTPGEGVCCDSCQVTTHSTLNCSGISTSEVRAIVLQKRSLLYFCEECREAFKSVPKLLREIRDMRKEMNTLKQEVEDLKQKEKQEVNNFEEIVMELEERKKKSKNVIILNIKESIKTNKKERIEDEMNTVKTILSETEVEDLEYRVQRIGKYEPGKNRPLRIVMAKPEATKEILRNKNKIKTYKATIFGDQTKAQREYYNKIKKQLEESKNRGENKYIKYINNIPTLVDCPPSKNY
nr:stress response protein NST1-like [Leptinotarsa decemlineata]